ncbi:DUF1028 domain-containing protein [Herpetosiphon giganteus]|uniref:DUF1028 domain-containing protein n=1 Tax=Herpetosiphon giganteus TaxID=2029754 RepID=UPI00195A7608|nr:DUF1028 domain-containing protein [Herpetosiphon giganteus]MBM7842521.1 putative Ntn-hydrolase superfamily protein [Herpetosiphon giganteus]
MTFSIVGYDQTTGDLGVAVASKFLAVGSVVSWAQAEAGAIATQSYANMSFGPNGLALLAQGQSAQATLDQLLAADEGREQRQVGVVDFQGNAATWTGNACHGWAGGRTGAGYAAQGNILTGADVVEAMATAFEQTHGELAERLLAALLAGDQAGGDQRGRQSAALYVARKCGAYGGVLDRYIDLRVDDHHNPVPELGRLLGLHRFYLTPPKPEDLLPIDAALALEIQTMLQQFGYYQGELSGDYDAATHAALQAYGGVENLEERLVSATHIDRQVLNYLRKHFVR